MKRIIMVFLTLVLISPLFSQQEIKTESQTQNTTSTDRKFKIDAQIGLHLKDLIYEHFFPAIEFHIIGVYQFNSYVSAVGGTGMHIYFVKNVSSRDENVIAFPVFEDIKGGFFNKRITPFLSLKTGCIFPTWDNYTYSDIGTGGFYDVKPS